MIDPVSVFQQMLSSQVDENEEVWRLTLYIFSSPFSPAIAIKV